jgi:solute:Na+ symporter, SSS family
MYLSILDIGVVVLYAVLLLVVAYYVSPEGAAESLDTLETSPRKRTLPWWAIGTSLIAANISAEQIIGMSGSAYAFGLAIASYEWMAAIAILIAGKYFLPVFLKNGIHTMPEFLQRRYGRSIQLVMAVFWLLLYIFVNLTAILWLGATAVHTITGLNLTVSLILLGLFAGNYALYVGLRAASATDAVQVLMLVLGGLVIVYIALEAISGGSGVSGFFAGMDILAKKMPEHFHMILKPDNPFYKYAPGLAMVAGGMWVINMCYWGFNQYIIQRALTAQSVREAQKGVVLAAFLKLLIPVLVVLPGIAAVMLVHPSRPDEAYPLLMTTLPHGLLGFVFVALVAAIIASMGSTLSSIAAIFSHDVLRNMDSKAGARLEIISGRFVAIVALLIAMAAAMPILGHVDQAFQYIQEFTGFITPGVLTIFLLGMFWDRATEGGALAAAIGSVLASVAFYVFLPHVAFVNRVGYVFLVCLALAGVVSLMQKPRPAIAHMDIAGVDYSTSTFYNVACFVILAILAAIYTIWW